MKKIFILIEHDIIIRNFIESSAFSELEKRFDVYYVTPSQYDNKFSIDIEKKYGITKLFRVFIPNERLFIWKKYFYFNEFNLLKLFDKNFLKIFPLYFTNVGWKAITLFIILNLPILSFFYKIFLRKELNKYPNKQLKKLLQIEKPNLIIHPTTLSGYFVNDGIQISNQLNIPHIFIMNSWDNPSTKKSAIYKPNKLLVWGAQTFNHAKTYIKMKDNDIIKFGAAQFEIYNKKPTLTKSAFRKEHNFEKNQKIILYAGVNRGKHEHEHLEIISQAIEEKVLPNYKIIYKPHPWGCLQKTAELVVDKKIKHVFPEKSMQSYLNQIKRKKNNKKFLMANYKRTNDILKSVDLVISPLSTILLEAGLIGLPVLCIFPEEEQRSFFHINLNKAPHFEDIIKIRNIAFVRKKQNLIDELSKLITLSEKPNFSDKLKSDMSFLVSKFNTKYSKRLNILIESLLK